MSSHLSPALRHQRSGQHCLLATASLPVCRLSASADGTWSPATASTGSEDGLSRICQTHGPHWKTLLACGGDARTPGPFPSPPRILFSTLDDKYQNQMFPHTEGWAHPIRSATQLRTLMPATPSASPGHDSSSSVLSSCLVPWELPAPSGPPHLVSLLSQGLLWLTYGASPPLRTKLWARNAAGSSIQRLFLGGGQNK